MSLTTGSDSAPPLWAYCSSSQEYETATTVDCQIPMLPKLVMGHVFRIANAALNEMDWSVAKWELYIDNQPINWEAFGLYHFVLPVPAHSLSFIREISRKMTAWDVVLTNLQAGVHVLRGAARA